MSRTTTTTPTNDAANEGAPLAYVENEISLGSLTAADIPQLRTTIREVLEQRRREEERLKAMQSLQNG